jgi:hypothetical protein
MASYQEGDLITAREQITETFLKEIIDTLPEPPNTSAVELARAWKDEARKRIGDMSVTLSHRVQPIVQLLLEEKLAKTMDKSFLTVEIAEPLLEDMANRYKKCFNIWIDASQHVSFKATNTRLLGNVSAKDMYILTYFAFLTCKRAKCDNILQLGLVGCSTAGKSTLFEACLMEGSHVTTNEAGVGRFQVGNKPVLMFHDISIRTLVASKDTEKIKTIARTEPTVTKIYSTVYTLPPLFLFYSSNERLMTHKFSGPLERPHFSRTYPSQVMETGRKRTSEESLAAVQNRFIEAFVRSPPPLNKDDLPTSGGFQRIHAILGLFKRIVAIMRHHEPEDFFSNVLVQYVLHGLCANNAQHSSVMQCDGTRVLQTLVDKFVKETNLKQSLLRMLLPCTL